MKKIIFICFPVSLLLSVVGSAQTPLTPLAKESKFTIRNAFEEPDDNADPAEASFTLPDTGKSSYLINFGITYDFVRNKLNSNDQITGRQISPFIVLNKNTMISKEQYNYKAGMAYQWMFGKGNTDPGPAGNKQLYSNIQFINVTAQYLHDFTDTAHSILITGYWSCLKGSITQPENSLFLSTDHLAAGSWLFYYLAPTAGLEWQDIFQAKQSAIGFQSRIYANADVRLSWRHPTRDQHKHGVTGPYAWPKLLELGVSYTARINCINTVDHSDAYVPLFKPSLTYYPTEIDNLSLCLSYNAGADPVAGLDKQHYWKLAIQFQL